MGEPKMGGNLPENSKTVANQALDLLVSRLGAKGGIDLNQLGIGTIRNQIRNGLPEGKTEANQVLDRVVQALSDSGENLTDLVDYINTIRREIRK